MGMAGDTMENNSLPNGDFEKSVDIEVINNIIHFLKTFLFITMFY